MFAISTFLQHRQVRDAAALLPQTAAANSANSRTFDANAPIRTSNRCAVAAYISFVHHEMRGEHSRRRRVC